MEGWLSDQQAARWQRRSFGLLVRAGKVQVSPLDSAGLSGDTWKAGLLGGT